MRTKAHCIRIQTLGCAKNLVDSEVLHSQLSSQGFAVTHEENYRRLQPTDILVINTCGFIEQAKEQSIEAILRAVSLKEQGLAQKVFVIGCLSARYADQLREEIPLVDGYFGSEAWAQILHALGARYRESLLSERTSSTPSHYAYLKISEGCNRPCSFCAIPKMRGKHTSKSIESIYEEAHYLVQKGVREIILIAQDSTYYGLDRYGSRRLADLLHVLTNIEHLSWIRIHYAYPLGFPKSILKVMTNSQKICRYLDMPIQHASYEVLKRMRRPMRTEALLSLCQEIREKVPGIALRTTCIVGFPGETERDFQELLNLVQKVRFERLGAFTYSHEEGTYAHQYKDNISASKKYARYQQLMSLQKQISLEHNQSLVGQDLQVMVDKKTNDGYVGRSTSDSPEVDNHVHIESISKLRVGELVNIEVSKAESYDLYGKVAER